MCRVAAVSAIVSLLLVAPTAAAATADKTAKVELATGGTLYGVGLGVMTAWQAGLSPRPAAWETAALAGAMFYGTWRAAEWGAVTPARARFIESAAVWTTTDVMLLNFAVDGIDDGQPAIWLGLGTLGASAALAALVAPAVHLTSGQMSLMSSGGIWVPVGGLLFGVTAHLGDGRHLPLDLLTLNLVGLTTAAVLTRYYDPQRKQVLTMDAGVLLGGLSGGLLGLIMLAVTESYEQVSGLAFVGMGVGAALAIDKAGFDKRLHAPVKPAAVESALTLPIWSMSW